MGSSAGKIYKREIGTLSKYDLYDYNSSELAHSYAWHLPMIKNIVKASSAKSIIEVGCGNGSLGKYIMSRFEAKYLGIDSSSEGIARAKQNGEFDQNFILGDVTDPKMCLGQRHDLCISIDVIEHIVDLSGYLKFIKRHLRPQGVAFISTTYHSYCKWLLLAALGKIPKHIDPLWPGGRCKFFSKSHLFELFRQHGFVIDVRTYGLRMIPSTFYVTAKIAEMGR